ncbi:MAG TPA: 2Fe-2S iron-sulfur cluster-binding protein [Bdellovibrionales bacterium]|nr:2Fe-2S iron-sulfur cluster-binding protein [Bdellovibrionales bacterium]
MKVKFLPQNLECEIGPNQSVLDVANENKIYIKSVCRGVPSCAECRVRLLEGEHNVFPPMGKELNLIGTAYFVDQRRLSCQLRCFGDITVDLTEQLEKQQTTSKAPRGITKDKVREESHAKMGNIIFEQVEESTAQEAAASRYAEEDKLTRKAELLFEIEQRKRELERLKQQRQGQAPAQGPKPVSQPAGKPGGDKE